MKNFIKMIKKKCSNLNIEQVIIIVLFGAFAVYLLQQHRLIGMYYDDFGNASLSYGYDSSGINGTNYSFGDLFSWAEYVYFNWGGRVLYALFLIPLLKDGPHLFMMIQAVIILMIFCVMYRIVRQYAIKSYGYLIVLSFVVMYGLLQGEILKNGFYWASASVLYVWPMLPFMVFTLYYSYLEKKVEDNKKITCGNYIILVFLIPLVTLSQEQLGGALIVWLIFNDIFKHWGNENKYLKLDIFTVVYATLTYGFMFGAPGNWARMATNMEYSEMSFVEKIGYGLKNVILLLIHRDMIFFNIMLVISGILMIFMLKKDKSKIYLLISSTGILFFGVVLVCEIFGLTCIESLKEISFLIFLIDMFVICICYFGNNKKIEFLAFLLAAVASVFCLVFSPNFSLRSCIPYIFICIMFVAIIINDYLKQGQNHKTKVVIYMLLCVISIKAVKNVCSIYIGYEKNYYIDNYNFDVLKKSNGEQDKIVLVKYDNDTYRGTMSCDSGFEYIDSWMKEYYNIPQDVAIEWKTLSELSDYAKRAMEQYDVKWEKGFYEDEGGYRWAEQEAQMTIYNAKEDEVKYNFKAKICTGALEKSILTIRCNGEKVFEGQVDSDGVNINLDIILKKGENTIEFITDAERIDSGADNRNLYMNFSNIKYSVTQ